MLNLYAAIAVIALVVLTVVAAFAYRSEDEE